MRNPIRSEADAFRFVWLTIGYFALIVIGSVISVWLGVAVFAVLTLGALVWVLARRGRDAPPTRQAPAPSPPEQHRVLVVANEAVGGRAVAEALGDRVTGREARVLVVCPAVGPPAHQWASDVDGDRDEARARLERSLAALRAAGVDAEGEVGDADAIQAIEDAIRMFRPDELVLTTAPDGAGLVEKVRERFALAVTHVTADLP
jgi:hypothetical protein